MTDTAPSRLRWIVGALTIALAVTVALGARIDSARASALPNFPRYTGSGIPVGSGIPPWGFHASQSFPGAVSGDAHGWGDVDLATNWIDGNICETLSVRGGAPVMMQVRLGPRIVAHSHVAEMWGFPGNLVKAPIRVVASTDPRCAVGTTGVVTMYASYNGVRSDSIRFSLGAGCADENHLYHHGAAVDAQVPPL